MARKGENIYKRKDGRWEGRYIYSYDGNGKAKYKYLYAKTYAEVKRKLISAQSLSQLIMLQQETDNKNKYNLWLDDWLSNKKTVVKESTFIRYKNIVENHIKPELGEYSVGKISTSLLMHFITSKYENGRLNGQGGLSAKTISDIMIIVKDSFQYIQSNGVTVICNFNSLNVKQVQKEMRVLSMAEEQKLVTTLISDMDIYKLGIFICLYTGIRIGELCALQWKNISLSEKTIKIEKTMQRVQCADANAPMKTHITVTNPKSYSSIRIIPIPDFLLNNIKKFQGLPNSYILSNKNHNYIEPRTMQNRFKSYLTVAGIEDANFHSLRHTFATRCIEAGFDVKTLSEILGHASVKITLDKYVHSSMQLKKSNMEKLQLRVI